ncbi:DENTIN SIALOPHOSPHOPROTEIN [Salix koriyanagi]|uniref:DENTIN SIALOPHOSPHOPROTEIN n=1 Tax=Salix koriyanagi TaxID=2511006 RepID=A0A9Q0X3B3_9ROSI|nr:DENTIN SIALOPHOSPHOPROTEIN [Salix koriyanagi]
MGIDAKEFQAFMWRVVIFSINTCATLAQKYPFASRVLLSLLILYLFLPSVFFFLIYSLPFLGCTAVFIHYYLNPQRPRIQHGDERKERGISSTEARRLLQNNDESDANAVKEEKNMVSSMISNDELIGRTALAEEKPKTIMEERESCDGSNEQPRKLQAGGEVEPERSSSEADDDEEEEESEKGGDDDEEEEEESEKGGENAVQWTDYDQKNVMELGNSEIERNRRLEILIARRKARRSFKMNNIAGSGPRHPVLVARSNTFHVSKRSDEQIPGSAPSILLPTQNPFDLPYDPHEEKPNLMAGSFHEEFMADYLKEFPFCRHESFSSGNSLQDNRQGQNEGRGYSRSKMQSGNGNHDRLVDHLLFQGGETLRRNLSVTDLMTEEPQSSNQVASKQERDREVGTTRIKLIDEKVEQSHCKDPSLGNGSDIQMDKGANAIKHSKILSNPSSSAEDIFNAKKAGNPESIQPPTFKFPEVFYDRAPNSLPCPVPKARVLAEPSYDSSPSAIDSTRLEEHFIYKLKPGHTPNHSIASDMHVEVSETGSPSLIEDGTASSNDDESLIYDGDSEKELTSGSEELWGASPLAPKDQEHAKALIQIYEEGEEGMTELGFSRVRNEPEDPISRAEISQEDQAQSMKIDPKLSNHVKDQVEEVREQRPSNASDLVPPENSLEGTRLMEGSMAHTPSEMYFLKPQESPSASGNSAEEKKTNCDANDTVSFDDREYLKSNENRHVGAESSIMQEVSGNLSEPAGGNNSASNGNIKIESLFNPENCVAGIGEGTYNVNDSRFLINDHIEDSKSNEERKSEAERVMQAVIGDLSQPVESNSESSNYIESKSLNSPEKSREEEIFNNGNDPSVQIKDSVEDFKDVDQDSERLTEDSDIQSILMPVEAEDNPTSTQGSKEDQSTIEVGVSVVNQPFIDPTTSATLPEFVVEQVSNNSSLSSSPKSVLAYRIPADIGSTSDFSQLVDTGMEENLPITATQDTSLVVNDSIDHPSIDTKSEEPYDTQGMCTEEAIDMGNMNGSELDDEKIKENLKSRKNIEYESETLISNEASVELSKPLEEPQTADHLEEKEESTNIPRDVAGEVNHISDASDPSINKNDDLEKLKSFEGSEGEPQFSTGHEIFAEPLKSANITSLEGHEYSPGVLTENETIVATSQAIEEVYNSRTSKETDEFGTQIADQENEDLFKPGEAVGSSETTKDVQGDPKDLIDQKAVLNPSTPAVDDDNILVTLEAKDSSADMIHNVKESEMCEVISNEKFKHVQDSEDESEILDRQEDIMEPLKAVEKGKLTVLMTEKRTEDSGKSIAQENGMGISETSRGDDIARAVEDNKGKSEDKNEING